MNFVERTVAGVVLLSVLPLACTRSEAKGIGDATLIFTGNVHGEILPCG